MRKGNVWRCLEQCPARVKCHITRYYLGKQMGFGVSTVVVFFFKETTFKIPHPAVCTVQLRAPASCFGQQAGIQHLRCQALRVHCTVSASILLLVKVSLTALKLAVLHAILNYNEIIISPSYYSQLFPASFFHSREKKNFIKGNFQTHPKVETRVMNPTFLSPSFNH